MTPIFVAIDTADLVRARALALAVAPLAGGIKLGLEYFSRNGRDGVAALADLGVPIFLDLKFHDIPNTVAGAIAALGDLDLAVLTVHAAGGRAMMEAARAAASPATKVVAVTVLTSLDHADLASIGVERDPSGQVGRLTDLTRAAGLDGIVCSGNELGAVHARWNDGYLIVPGIRLAAAEVDDQKRIMTPRDALDAGASMLVIGRPITLADDPAAALAAIAATL